MRPSSESPRENKKLVQPHEEMMVSQSVIDIPVLQQNIENFENRSCKNESQVNLNKGSFDNNPSNRGLFGVEINYKMDSARRKSVDLVLDESRRR